MIRESFAKRAGRCRPSLRLWCNGRAAQHSLESFPEKCSRTNDPSVRPKPFRYVGSKELRMKRAVSRAPSSRPAVLSPHRLHIRSNSRA